jgi:predicted transposase/invertase (TIGR01784 family)
MIVLNPEIPRDAVDHKGIALDIVGTTVKGERIQLEMQARHHAFFKERAFYYATRLHASQLKIGHTYEKLRPTYCINFLNFDQFDCPNPDRYVHIFEMRERETHHLLTNHLEVYFVELHKFLRSLQKNPRGSNNPHLDNWLRFLLNPSDKRLQEVIMSDPIISQAMRRLVDISKDAATREIVRMRERAEHEWASMMSDARHEGKAEGLAEGETKARLDVLKTLLMSPVTAALSDSDLAAMVHLPVDQVAQVRAQHQR